MTKGLERVPFQTAASDAESLHRLSSYKPEDQPNTTSINQSIEDQPISNGSFSVQKEYVTVELM